MAISFNKDSVFTLKPMSSEKVRAEVEGLLIDEEIIVAAFSTIRDQLIFTNKRIISVDVQGISGKRRSFATLPYSRIQFFTVETPGLLEAIPSSSLSLVFSNGTVCTFDIQGSVNIGNIARVISEYVLEK